MGLGLVVSICLKGWVLVLVLLGGRLMRTYLGLGFEAVPGGGEDLAVVVGEGVGGHCCRNGFWFCLRGVGVEGF